MKKESSRWIEGLEFFLYRRKRRQNFRGKMGSTWLHMYGRKRFYIRQRVNFPKSKTHKNEGRVNK